MPYGEEGQCFVVLGRAEGSLAAAKFYNMLRFKVKEIDPSSGAAPLGPVAPMSPWQISGGACTMPVR